MRECWLKTNRRALAVTLACPILLLLLAAGLGFLGACSGTYRWMIFVAVPVAVIAVAVGFVIICAMKLPRLGYEDGYLLVYVCGRHPIRVPVDIVEVFFLGQGPSLVKAKDGGPAETSTIVVRLAESAAEWHNRQVDPALAEWAGGYIVIRGTWCEPINAELMKRLNSRLVEVHRQQREPADKLS